MEKLLPSIPAKRYFTIGEVGDLCGVKPHVLRYWEQEFNQLRPMKRRGNRRYYQHHEVLMIRRIRDLLYDQGFTISGARNKIQELIQAERELKKSGLDVLNGLDAPSDLDLDASPFEFSDLDAGGLNGTNLDQTPMQLIRRELQEISNLLGGEDRSKG
ncbi:MAG: MerR family transcriptional regulator [Betaproteobacteria bacterium]|nr:MerR family transcriptional regulator [Betaproteobacteria bacterium]NDD12217.1 MerR family transcriptional regulator [Betaproteobacteria bacterium]